MITYINTINHNGYTYQDYIEDCEESGREPGKEASAEYYRWLGRMVDLDIEDFLANTRHSKVCRGPVTVRGHLGLWWGRPKIEPEKFDDFESAIRACWGDCDDTSITLDKGILTVVGYHHDGRNVFTIHREHGYFWPKYLY